jgi:hypothetical protein
VLEAGELVDRLDAGVVGAHAVFHVFREAREQAEMAFDDLHGRHRFVARVALSRPADERRQLGRVDVQAAGRRLPARRQPDAEVLLDLLAALLRLVVAAHGRNVPPDAPRCGGLPDPPPGRARALGPASSLPDTVDGAPKRRWSSFSIRFATAPARGSPCSDRRRHAKANAAS